MTGGIDGGGIEGGGIDGGMSALVSGGLIGPTIALEAPGLENFILRYEIRVEWGDFDPPDFVRRTTYAFDWEGARQALPDLFTAAGSDGIPSILDDPSAAGGSVQELIDQIEGAR